MNPPDHACTFAPTDTLQGRVAVIAGGTGAIGLATARRLALLGARCVLLYRSGTAEAAAAQAAALPGGTAQGHSAVYADITDSATLRAAAAHVAAACGGVVHILVNSAGHTKAVPAGDLEGLSLAKAAALGQAAASIKLSSRQSVADELNRDRLKGIAGF